jgi:hypothetical protein
MRTLSERQASQCEGARTPRCRCRCGGALHGANRVVASELPQLASTDPHRINPPSTRRRRATPSVGTDLQEQLFSGRRAS